MLYVALIFVIIVLLIEKWLKSTNKETRVEEIKNNNYTKKEYLLTQQELKFYKILKQITDKLELNLFCQVAMYEIINTKEYKDFNRIKSKSIDFVITEKNCKIKLCIELDDETHKRQDRIERDNFVNEVFKNANTKLLRIKTQNYYNLEELEKQIKESISPLISC